MKTPVMVEVYRQAEEGSLALNDTLRVENKFRSVADGSHYSLDPADHSHQTLYRHLGERRSIRSLLRAMIVASSNLATNLLIEHVGAENVTSTMRHLGAEGVLVRRGVEDTKAFGRGRNNETTARGLLVIFDRIARGTVVSQAACTEMIEILTDQQHTDIIPAQLPDGVDVAHKTGWISGLRHDSGIVFVPEGPTYVLVLLSRDLSDVDAGGQALATISRYIFDEVCRRYE